MLVLTRENAESLLDLDQLVDAVASAMVDLTNGQASMPPRGAAYVGSRHALLAAMPAFLPSSQTLVTKLVSLFPENRDRPTHQAIICVFDPDNGTPLALLDGTYITTARTSAGSALATRLLARKDARAVSVIGTGVQARAHARALARAVPVDVVRIAGRDQDRVRTLTEDLATELSLPVEAAASIEDAVRSAEIVCATTHSDQPVVRREWLAPGTHVNSVGYNSAGEGEVDSATVRDSVVVVESRAAALAPPPSGAVELRLAIQRGLFAPEQVHAEIGELVTGAAVGRTDDSQLTLYKSVGVAVQDAAAATLLLRAAEQRGVGDHIAL
jgi:ornithine cyclodeaminase/alanine dehydrogenase-like protein (mu-crystallin family)